MQTSKYKPIILFEDIPIRRKWVEKDEKWYFSIIDIVQTLTESPRPRKYWNALKTKLKDEGSEVSQNMGQLKLIASDGKMRETDVADIETIFRIIQSVPSKKAEPFKRWLAKVGYERVQEIENPEIAQERMKMIYKQKGYSKNWIDKRLRGIAVRQDLTDEWQERGVNKNLEYAILTNQIMQGAFGMEVDKYKKFKNLKRENLRDHMTDLELILTMLGEATTTKITKDRDSKGFPMLKKDAQDGGKVAGRTRKDIESQSDKIVVSEENYLKISESQKRFG